MEDWIGIGEGIGALDRYNRRGLEDWICIGRRGLEDRICIGEGIGALDRYRRRRLEDWIGIGEGDWMIG